MTTTKAFIDKDEIKKNNIRQEIVRIKVKELVDASIEEIVTFLKDFYSRDEIDLSLIKVVKRNLREVRVILNKEFVKIGGC